MTIIIILFGAPLTTHLAHNLLCATHMALLMFQPLFYVYGVDAVMWKEVCSAFLPWDGVWGGTVGAAVGAWCGAAPIPLDWWVFSVSFCCCWGMRRCPMGYSMWKKQN